MDEKKIRRVSPGMKKAESETATADAPLKIARYRTTTLGDLGARLPVGIPSGQKFERTIGVREFTLAEEKEIGGFRAKAKGLTAGRLVSEVLSVTCTQLGPHDFEKMKKSERLVALAKMQMMDVLYTYFWVRVESLGTEFPIGITCPGCRSTFRFSTDLNDLDVKVIDYGDGEEDTLVDQTFEHILDEPITFGKETGTALTIGPIEWAAMDTPALEGIHAFNPAIRDMVMLKGAIKELDGKPIIVTLQDLERARMRVKTKNELMAAVQESMAGPQLFIEADCEKCARSLMQTIEWSYDVFFGLSSPSESGEK